ncbi:MAG: hypothetical protein AAFZ15_04460 [Bacteroidota bacterium]
MKFNHLVIIFTLLLIAFSSCQIGDDDSTPTRNFYSFSLGLEIDPVKTEYQNGDIFWLSTSIPTKELTDTDSGNTVRVGNGKFTFQIDVYDPFAQPDDTDKFNLAEQIGEVTEIGDFEETGSALISFGCPSSTYTLNTGIQFIKLGGYLVYLNRDQPLPQVIFTDDDDCSLIPDNQVPPDNADIGSVSYSFDVDDTNKEAFETYAANFPNSSVDLTSIRNALDEKRAFFVLVK